MLNYSPSIDFSQISHHLSNIFFMLGLKLVLSKVIFDYVNRNNSRPIIRRYTGTLNAFQSLEIIAIDCRDLICGRIDVNNFRWNPFPHRPVSMCERMMGQGLKVPQNL